MNDDDSAEGLAGALYQLANEAEQLSRRIRAQSVVLRHAHERAVDRLADEALAEHRAGLTESVVLHCQPLSLDTATKHIPMCDRTGVQHPLSSCLGCHPEGE